ncbi:hypothetical protein U6N30_17400 [Blastococcus brunescens]|uniref:Uncharacterized protein n=1 Tax=Blastococcus brunescens TaxID=1564165 RepID=A0ABZ1ATH9_9ACTN|nr:hypothetical protein [Blastococcus sp. BMG 8361]WRL61884.1 hypothetical protein U6N30_17400 [Blastococcus sp. BMG 8361]
MIALPRLRTGAPSWAAEGAAAGVALVPSALVVVAEPTALRLVLVVVAAALLTVAGTLLHRQAPFVVGTGVLLFVAVGRLGPYAPLLPAGSPSAPRGCCCWSSGPPTSAAASRPARPSPGWPRCADRVPRSPDRPTVGRPGGRKGRR